MIPVARTVAEVRSYTAQWRSQGLKVGLVPTMGFLHEGHQSLVSQSLDDNDVTVVSVFVNPSQFAPGEDLDSYPRNLDHDLDVLSATKGKKNTAHSVSLVYVPAVQEMYPSGIPLDVSEQKGAFVNVIGVSEQLEGERRPAFFRGVTTVVSKLFNIVEPANAYFGQKDVQQTVVVRRMVRDLFFNLTITVMPIVRNKSGLALSSRNAYLSDPVKEKATVLYQSLQTVQKAYKSELDVKKLTTLAQGLIEAASKEFKIDYVSFSDPDDLHYLDTIDPAKGCIVSLAVYVPNEFGKKETTRLIDNVILGKR